MSRLDVEVAAVENMPPAQLRPCWSEIDDRPMPGVPTSINKLLVAHRFQERRLGGFPLCHIPAEYCEKRFGLDLAANHTVFPISDQ